MSEQMFISIRNWRRFQHYSDRRPIWIKSYLELMDDPAYLGLTEHQALMLHRLWLTYASARCHLPLSTSSLSRQLGLRVMTRDIEALNHAGFIDIVASKSLADGYQVASTEVEVEVEISKEVNKGPELRAPAPAREAGRRNGTRVDVLEALVRNVGWQYEDASLRAELVEKGADEETVERLLALAAELREAEA